MTGPAESALALHEVEFIDGKFQKVEGTDKEIAADFVFLAMGFVGPEKGSWLDDLGVDYDARGNVVRDDNYMTNSARFVCGRRYGSGTEPDRLGDCRRASSRGWRRCSVMGETSCPEPIGPTERPLM